MSHRRIFLLTSYPLPSPSPLLPLPSSPSPSHPPFFTLSSSPSPPHLGVVVKHKLRYVYLVGVDGVVEILDSSEVLDAVLDLHGSEREEPPRLQLWGEGDGGEGEVGMRGHSAQLP